MDVVFMEILRCNVEKVRSEMEDIEFVKLSIEHGKKVIDIFNYYAENSFAAYPEKKLPYEFIGNFMAMTQGYPAYSIIVGKEIVGFCFIRAFNPFSAFKETAEITYFIDVNYSGRGIGKIALNRLENEAEKMGIKTILASITSENIQSLSFHKKNGFLEYGRLPGVGKKFGQSFDLIMMGKAL